MYVFLSGPPGGGKTVVAPLVASAFGARVVELDEVIARRAGKPIARVFGEEGESRFRQLEREALLGLRDTPAWVVVAAGGGAVIDRRNRGRMRELGVIVNLGASFAALLRRTRGGDRPLLAGDAPGRLRRLLAARREAYADADVFVRTDRLSPEEVAEAVVAALVVGRGATVEVTSGGGYAAHVRAGALDDVGKVAARAGIARRVALVTDSLVETRYARRAVASLRAVGLDTTVLRVPRGEAAKSPRVLERLWRALGRARFGRDDGIVALGGGSVTDLAGFVAATYARGIPWIAAPTTLLGMVDAALGGKTAVDLPEGKNLAGAFHDPRGVVSDVALLGSLSARERRSGLAEVVKTALLADVELFGQIERAAPALRDGALPPLFAAVAASAEVKAGVVSADPREAGERMTLNFGHTFGHALEAATDYRRFAHGEAVALGMVFACALAESLGLCPLDLRTRLEAVLERIGLPTRCGVPPRVWDALQRDKKRRAGTLRWVLPRRIGTVSVVEDVPVSALRRAAHVLRA